jgi:hypothetical protein
MIGQEKGDLLIQAELEITGRKDAKYVFALRKRESISDDYLPSMCKAVLSISDNVYKQKEMEIDTALSEIESKYDFTFKLPDAKTLNTSFFFILRLKIDM